MISFVIFSLLFIISSVIFFFGIITSLNEAQKKQLAEEENNKKHDHVLPCPLCGSASDIKYDGNGHWWYIECSGCHLQSEKMSICTNVKDKLLEKWNKRMSIDFPRDLDVDDNGYPNDDMLDQLQKTDNVKDAASWLLNIFPKLVRSMPFGHLEISDGSDDFGNPIKIVSYSTGGWSGQEDLITAVEKSIIGILYLYSWRRGGHYVFHVPLTEK